MVTLVILSTPPALAAFYRFGFDGVLCVGLVALIVFLATSTRRLAKRCPRCRVINRHHANFCAQCGTRLTRS